MRYIIIILLLFACNKPQEPVVKRYGGLLPDNEKAVDKVPLLTSKGFIDVASKGKPVTNISFVSPANGATVTGIVTIKTSVTSTIYLDGVQVSSTGLYLWNTEGAAKGFHTIQAAVKGTKIAIGVFIETVIIDPVDTVPTQTGVRLTMPSVSNQGSEGSCVAFAVGYSARSTEWFYKTGTMVTFSPEHLFNNVKFGETCDVGTAMQTALEFIMANGILPLSEMPYTSGTCQPTETEAQKQIALNYKIDGYYKIYTTDKAAIRSMIDQKKPVIISIACDQSFLDAKAGFIWRQYSGSGYLNHCVTVCGYDDTKNAYLIQNSWGTSWGEEGKCWIDYNFFTTRTGTYCYAIK